MFLFNGSALSRELTPLYSWWASVMILQMLSFSWLTGRLRVRHEAIHSEEDRMWLKNSNTKLCVNGGGHPEIDYVRSKHLEDLKIIIPYLLITPIWLNSDPFHFEAQIVLRLFPISKVFDTLLYMKFFTAPEICRHFMHTISCIILAYITIASLISSV